MLTCLPSFDVVWVRSQIIITILQTNDEGIKQQSIVAFTFKYYLVDKIIMMDIGLGQQLQIRC